MSMPTRRKQPWSGPEDKDEQTIQADSITILQYWDITTPPPKHSKLKKLRSTKRRPRRISLEIHTIPKDVDDRSLELRDIFPSSEVEETASNTNSNSNSYKKAFFRTSKYVPIKSGKDDSTVFSEVSSNAVPSRTKNLFSKPDHEFRTKFLWKVDTVAIARIKKDKEVHVEAWGDGENVERTLVFRTSEEAKEFAYDLERLQNEDEDIQESLVRGPAQRKMEGIVIDTSGSNDLIIDEDRAKSFKSVKKEDTLIKKSLFQKTLSLASRSGRSVHTDAHAHASENLEAGLTTRTPQTSSSSSSLLPEPNRRNSNELGCCQKICYSISFIIATLIHVFGIIIALSLFFYSVAVVAVQPAPLTRVAIALFTWSLLLLITHGFGSMGIHGVCFGGYCCTNFSCCLAVVNILLNVSLVIVFTIEKDSLFDHLSTYHDKLFLSEDAINFLRSHVLWIYILMLVSSISEVIRIVVLYNVRKGIIIQRRTQNQSELETPLITV